MIPGRCSRMLRAAVFAAVCVLLAALAHVPVSGHTPAWWVVGAAAVGTGGAGWCLTGRERGAPLVTAVVVGAQAALHTAFSLAPAAVPAAGGTAGMDHGGPAPAGPPSAGMLAAHLPAALLCGLWLAHGERAVFRVLRAVAEWLTAPLGRPGERTVPAPAPRAGARARAARSARSLVLVHAITSRGPPERSAVARRRPEPYGSPPRPEKDPRRCPLP
ncbi:hypothetical protein ACFY30_36345 [Streptomyces sp. NPDC000345]|uniref:hypothetical protein n=1 Tax=Streptomyces sp. NPDC000345 TaxID=3364537 RepID=UPI00369C831E